MQHHNYSLSDLDNMIPWEREIYVDMLMEYIKEENKRQEEQNRSLVRNGTRICRTSRKYIRNHRN